MSSNTAPGAREWTPAPVLSRNAARETLTVAASPAIKPLPSELPGRVPRTTRSDALSVPVTYTPSPTALLTATRRSAVFAPIAIAASAWPMYARLRRTTESLRSTRASLSPVETPTRSLSSMTDSASATVLAPVAPRPTANGSPPSSCTTVPKMAIRVPLTSASWAINAAPTESRMTTRDNSSEDSEKALTPARLPPQGGPPDHGGTDSGVAPLP